MDPATARKNIWEEEVERLNGLTVRTKEDLLDALEKLRSIRGVSEKIIKGSPLEMAIQNFYGRMDIYTVESLINKVESDIKIELEANTVSKDKLDELVDEYNKKLGKGEDSDRALNEIVKENKNLTKGQVNEFIKKNTEFKDEVNKKSRELADKLTKDLNVDSGKKELLENRLHEKATEVIINNSKLSEKEKIRALSEEMQSFAREQNILIDDNVILTKETVLGMNQFAEENRDKVNGLARDNLQNEIIEKINGIDSSVDREIAQEYADLVSKIEYPDRQRVDTNQYKDEAIQYAEQLGINPGKISVGSDNLELFSDMINYGQKPKELVDQYKSLKAKIGVDTIRGIGKSSESVEKIVELLDKSPKLEKLVERAQQVFGFENSFWFRAAQKVGLDKVIYRVSEKFLGTAGLEFTKNALVILSQTSLEQGSMIILQSWLAGGSGALAVAAAMITVQSATTAVATAEALLATAQAGGVAAKIATAKAGLEAAKLALSTAKAGLEAAKLAGGKIAAKAAEKVIAGLAGKAGVAAIPVVGQIAAIAMALWDFIVKPLLKLLGKLADKLGINMGIKDFFKNTFGNIVGGILNFIFKLGAFIVALPVILTMTLVTTILIPIFICVFAVLFVVQLLFGGNQASSQIPSNYSLSSDINQELLDELPADTREQIISSLPVEAYAELGLDLPPEEEESAEVLGNIVLPQIIVGQVSRQDLVNMAMALKGKVHYELGGRWHCIGACPNWGNKKAVPARRVNSHGEVKYDYYDGVDCSGFVRWVYLQLFGAVVVSGSSYGIYDEAHSNPQWQIVNESDLKPGDIAWRTGHVALYTGRDAGGNKIFIEAYNGINLRSDTARIDGNKAMSFTEYFRPDVKFIGD